jgi:hypothetical protein
VLNESRACRRVAALDQGKPSVRPYVGRREELLAVVVDCTPAKSRFLNSYNSTIQCVDIDGAVFAQRFLIDMIHLGEFVQLFGPPGWNDKAMTSDATFFIHFCCAINTGVGIFCSNWLHLKT